MPRRSGGAKGSSLRGFGRTERGRPDGFMYFKHQTRILGKKTKPIGDLQMPGIEDLNQYAEIFIVVICFSFLCNIWCLKTNVYDLN